MKKMNKILAIILAILMVISIIPITASAATSGPCGDNLTWTVDESTGTLTISGTGDMYDGEFSYPSWNADLIENVIISEGVTSIGEYAFVSNSNIKNVSIADSVTDIGDNAFYNCTGLTNVVIGKGVTNIGDEAFYNCTRLTDVVIGKGVTTIGIRAFENCSNLESVTIYNAVEEIVRGSFTGCSKLTDVYYFGTEAEWNAISKGFTLGGIIVLGTGLENATIHFLGEETHECSYNAVVTAPTCTEQGYTTYTCECGDSYVDDYVDALGHTDNDNDGFCDICKKIAYPDAQLCGENIIWAFDESTGTLTLTGTGAMYDYESVSTSGFFINQPWYSFADKITKIVINDGVTYIGEYAFCKCENLTSITMSGSVTEIGCYAFAFCTGLTSLTIPYGVTTIDVGAFGGLLYLTTVTIPCSVKTIANEAFILSYRIKDVYYSGCEAQWNEIFIGTSNFPDATIHFLGEETHECSYNAVVTPPTCTEQGYTTYTCECGDSYVDDYVNATGHSHTSEITTPATHTTTGIETFTCSCGDTYTEVIEKLEKHNYESVVTAPTCTEQGYTTYTCECGDSYVDDYVDALGHAPANAVEENYIAPTCTENGSKDVVVYCSVCDEEISRETVTIEATGHADNDGDGYCDACNEQLEDNNDSQISIMSIIMMIINFILEIFGIK